MLYERKIRTKIRESYEFKQTNDIWNNFKMNQMWTIGHLTLIFNQKQYNSFEEWESYYLESGKKRQDLLSKLNSKSSNKLRALTANYSNAYSYKSELTLEELRINEHYGRTLGELKYIASQFHMYIKSKKPYLKLSLNDCFNYVYIRVIDEIFIGAMREENTLKRLKKLFPKYTFIKTDYDTDREFAVDIECFYDGVLVCGIQVKSEAYKVDKSKMLKETKSFNHDKNKKYEDLKNVPVIYTYSSVEGFIQNSDIFKYLK